MEPKLKYKQYSNKNNSHIFQALHRPTCVSRHLNLSFFIEAIYTVCWAQTLDDGKYHIQIREKMLEFSEAVLSALSLYHI